MGATDYITVVRHSNLDRSKRLDNIAPLSKRDDEPRDKPHDKSVSDLIKFIDERTLSILAQLLEQVYTVEQAPIPETSVEIPGDVQTGVRTYEQVSDINGITIPALLFCSSDTTSIPESLETSRANYLWNYLRYQFLSKTCDDKRHSFIKSYVKKIKESGLAPSALDKWLLLGNIFICANDGYNYKLRQITQYDWLTREMITMCHRNILQQIPAEIAKQSIFELELGSSYDGACGFYQFEHPVYGQIKLRGRVDCITPDTLWEFKCVNSLTLEHMLQLAIYAWIWKRQIEDHYKLLSAITEDVKMSFEREREISPGSQMPQELQDKIDKKIEARLIKEYSGYDAYLDKAFTTTRENIFQSRVCKLLNIRTGHVMALNDKHKNHLLDEIMETVLAAKLRIKKVQTDYEFKNDMHDRIKSYIPEDLHYQTMLEEMNYEDALDEPEDNTHDNQNHYHHQHGSNNHELDF
jgi:hypothetical protein